MIKAIIFDLDDTLYHELEYVKSGFRAVSNYIADKYPISSEGFYKVLLSILKKEGRGQTFDLALEEFGLSLKEVPEMVNLYRIHQPESFRLYPDAERAFNRLSGDYKLGLITDGISKVQWNKIEALGIKDRFDYILVSDDHGRENRKPAPFLYQKMIEEFEVSPQEAVYIGDNPDKDFVTAKKLGLKTVRIIRQQGMHINKKLSEKYEADYEIESLDELEEII
ncbi:haloacid dehalogenase superfamily enzyme, subfamily IA [Halobacteroides halobius DSM 5150]|uniref:Haloacid dehalogenase superfamily enzyme, subfamily IA n=1 Tax=Halobacteroides halobius (strain ATCC 35273 / DSM 5150 / MD-1) TaxID=748449 RepID=L0KCK5_HALHC|nr:HAD-IA family hydrolase [Halobacteroides halobius]AGB42119.1 haloacid dehalogenase superfamily enzyme, subfamily IA [Halobacteroides halobius DSM 5150]